LGGFRNALDDGKFLKIQYQFNQQLLCLSQIGGMLGMQDMNTDDMTRKLEEILPVIKQVNEQFKNPVSW
jgi:arsenite/tail-anchored protein-transporting ATPase